MSHGLWPSIIEKDNYDITKTNVNVLTIYMYLPLKFDTVAKNLYEEIWKQKS